MSELAYQDKLDEEAQAFAEHEHAYHEAELRKKAALDVDYG